MDEWQDPDILGFDRANWEQPEKKGRNWFWLLLAIMAIIALVAMTILFSPTLKLTP